MCYYLIEPDDEVDDSDISDSEFGLSEDEELINKNIKSSKVLYIKKNKI